MPAHAVAFTKVWPELGVHNTRVTTAGNTTRSAIDHLDVTKPETMELIKDIFDDYTTGENEVFDDETVVHIGADEFIIPNGRPAYCSFYNDLVPHLKANGNTVRVWGSFDSSYLQGGGTEPGPEGIEDVQMNIWSLVWRTLGACTIRASVLSTSSIPMATWFPMVVAIAVHTATTSTPRGCTTR